MDEKKRKVGKFLSNRFVSFHLEKIISMTKSNQGINYLLGFNKYNNVINF